LAQRKRVNHRAQRRGARGLRGYLQKTETVTDDAAILREFRSFQLDPPASDLLGEAFFLQGALYPPDRSRPDGRPSDEPLEDVYAAALSMLPHAFWVESPNHDQVYRGRCNATWRTTWSNSPDGTKSFVLMMFDPEGRAAHRA
jgi:hypothetical protein